MTIKEKVAYLEGLAEGMEIGATDSGKLFTAIIDTLSDIAEEIEELTENALDIGEELDAISDDLAEVEDFLLDEDYDFDDDDFDFDFDEDDDDYDDDDYDDDDYDDDSSAARTCDICGKEDKDDIEFTIDINCPQCNSEIELTDDDIANESVTCKSCGKNIELEIEEVDAEDSSEDEE